MPLNMKRHQLSNHPERTRCSQRVAIQARIVYTWEIRHNAVVASWYITQGQNESSSSDEYGKWKSFENDFDCVWAGFIIISANISRKTASPVLGKMYNVRINSVLGFFSDSVCGLHCCTSIRIIHWFKNIHLGKNKVNCCIRNHILPYYSSRKTVHDKRMSEFTKD